MKLLEGKASERNQNGANKQNELNENQIMNLYMNGNISINILEGNNVISIDAWNAGDSVNPAGLIASIYSDSTNTFILQTDLTWLWTLGGSWSSEGSTSCSINMCDGGNTPGFRPHSGRPTPWAFPGAEKFQTELANNPETEGFLDYPDAWISSHKADIIIAMFGYDESFQGVGGVENYKAELDAFIKHTLKQKYNGESRPQLAIVSPIAFEDLSTKFDLLNFQNHTLDVPYKIVLGV
jgi:uncharacterized protein YuzE